MGVTTGCYVYTPVAVPPAPGSRLLLELNDRGRVGLGGSIGSSAKSVEGLLQAQTDSAYSLKVVAVSYLNGQTNQWTGEQLVVSRDFVRDVTSRQYSRSRTFLAAAAIVAGTVLLIVTRSIIGGGSPGNGGGGGGGGEQS
jgi:hypothetical protein